MMYLCHVQIIKHQNFCPFLKFKLNLKSVANTRGTKKGQLIVYCRDILLPIATGKLGKVILVTIFYFNQL